MFRYLIYLFPMAINMLLGGMFFITAYRFAEAKAPGWIVGATMTAWALLYCANSFLLNRKLTPRNAPLILNAGCAMLAASSAGFLIFSGLYTQFVWILLAGLGSSSYCSPFQVLMKEAEPDQAAAGSARAAGMYTFSWSAGLATGPLLFGLLPPETVFAVNTVVSLLLWSGAFLLTRRIRAMRAGRTAAIQQEKHGKAAQAPVHNLAALGWLIGGTGVFIVSIVRVMWPNRGAELLIPKRDVGLSLALLSYVQAFAALALAGTRQWMRDWRPTLIYGTAGLISMLLYAFAPGSAWYFYLAALLFGIYSGFFYFLLVYFAIEDTAHAAKNVSMNEIIVGITGIVAPVFGGMLAAPGASGRAFYPAIPLILAVSLITIAVLRRTQKQEQPKRQYGGKFCAK